MKISLVLMVVMAFVMLQLLTAESDAATRRLQRRPNARQRLALARAQEANRRSASMYKRQQLARAARARSLSRSGRRRTTRRRQIRRGRRINSRTRSNSVTRRTSRRNFKTQTRTSRRSQNRRFRYNRRRGRQDQDLDSTENSIDEDPLTVDEVEEMLEDGPPSPAEAEAIMEAMEEDEEISELVDSNGDGVPDWCNPAKPMGAWLNFKNMRLWCADRGFTNFGPYGGVPSRDEATTAETDDPVGGEENVSDLQALEPEEASETVSEDNVF